LPKARELNGGLGGAHGGQAYLKNVFVCLGLNTRDIAPVEETMKQLWLGVVVAIGLTLPAFGQQAVKAINPEGVYRLNLTKSTGQGGSAPPKSQTINIVGDELTLISIQADSKPFTATYPVILDGKSHPVAGVPAYDASTYTPLDPYTVSVTRTKAGKVVETGTRIFSPNGNLIMITATAADGSYSNVAVFEKQ
jgi:hypothetical protein